MIALANVFLLALIWATVWLVYRRSMTKLWFSTDSVSYKRILLLFVVAVGSCLVVQYAHTLFSSLEYRINQDYLWRALPGLIWYDLNSVLMEELICRALIYLVILRWKGANWALFLSASAFGLWHWTNQGIWGNPLAMLLVFVLNSAMGVALGLAHQKTASLLAPLALHLGWNLTYHHVFSAGPFGVQLYAPVNPPELSGTYALISFIMLLTVPLSYILLLQSGVFHRGIHPGLSFLLRERK